jgi:hypothetical protein
MNAAIAQQFPIALIELIAIFVDGVNARAMRRILTIFSRSAILSSSAMAGDENDIGAHTISRRKMRVCEFI